MRGARWRQGAGRGQEGIIPAYAGSTRLRPRACAHRRDHPRVCGEHACDIESGSKVAGSSPRMRGARLRGRCVRDCRRIIPAYAGSTLGVSSVVLVGCGSSPRMRGALLKMLAVGGDLGIIPAYAGSTVPSPYRQVLSRDHPRVCGEHTEQRGGTETPSGSSPRMRGARGNVISANFERGIIPAYAGSTPSVIAALIAARDHPRVCGEHMTPSDVMPCQTGSSPRMRGALCGAYRRACVAGIIPAYAGSTLRPRT